MAEILGFKGITYGDVPVKNVLEHANNCHFKSIIIIAHQEDGGFVLQTSVANAGEILLDLKRAERIVMEEDGF